MLDDLTDAPRRAPAGADVLTPLLQGLRLQGVDYGRCPLRAPWGVAFPPGPLARFHYVSGGHSVLWTASTGWVALSQGDAVLLPRGGFHVVASSPEVAPTELESLKRTAASDLVQLAGGMEASAQAQPTHLMFCGGFRFEIDPQHPLLQLMPEALIVSGLATRDPNVPVLLQAMEREVQRGAAGSTAILARLADALAASIIRAWAESAPAGTSGWAAALQCPRIGKVIAAIHREPHGRWTVARLACVMGASRSTFTDAFTRALGQSPARYVAQVRMAQASRWIGEQGMRVSSAAYKLGYESEAAFSRAFKRVMGHPPGQARRADI